MKNFIAIVLLFASTSMVSAQTIFLPKALTQEESYLNGCANLLSARGVYVESLGRAMVAAEHARNLYIENWKFANRSRWEIQDENKMRFQLQHPTYLDSLEHRLNMAERAYKLRTRENELIEKGILPPRGEPVFIVNGKKFRNVSDYFASKEYLISKEKQKIKQAEEQLNKESEQIRQLEALRFLKMWDKMSFTERQQYSRMSPAEKKAFKEQYKLEK